MMRLRPGSRLEPCWRSLQHSLRPLSWIWGMGHGGKGQEGEEVGRRGKTAPSWVPPPWQIPGYADVVRVRIVLVANGGIHCTNAWV